MTAVRLEEIRRYWQSIDTSDDGDARDVSYLLDVAEHAEALLATLRIPGVVIRGVSPDHSRKVMEARAALAELERALGGEG